MTTVYITGGRDRATPAWRHPTTLRKSLLISGILSSALYVVMNVVVAAQWPGYSSASQTISELSAIGAPTRQIGIVLGAFYTLLVTVFGWGIVISAGERRPLRVAGWALIVYGALGIAWLFFPMHLRETLAAGGGTLSDTMHIVLAMVTVFLMVLAILCAAAALGIRFRVYSVATLAILLCFGLLTTLDAPKVSSNAPTPWLGVWERVNVGVFLLWVVVIAIVLLREAREGGMARER